MSMLARFPGILAPIARGRRPGPRRVFPFRLARQTIRLAGLLAQPSGIGERIRVTDVDHRMPVVLREAGRSPCLTARPVSAAKAAYSPRVTGNFPSQKGRAIVTWCCGRASLSSMPSRFDSASGTPIRKVPAGISTISGPGPSRVTVPGAGVRTTAGSRSRSVAAPTVEPAVPAVSSDRSGATVRRNAARRDAARSGQLCHHLLGVGRAMPQRGEIEPLPAVQQNQHGGIMNLVRLDIRNVDIAERKDQIAAAEFLFALAEAHHFLTAHLAFQEGGGDDREQERRLVQGFVDFLEPIRAIGDGGDILKDMHLLAPSDHAIATHPPADAANGSAARPSACRRNWYSSRTRWA